MSNISKENLEKLRSLIFSDELRSVKQGLTLWEALISYDYFEEELNHLLDGCTSLNFQDNLQEDLIDKFENKTHAVYISVFLLQYIISFRNDIQVFSLDLSGVNVDDYKDFLLTKAFPDLQKLDLRGSDLMSFTDAEIEQLWELYQWKSILIYNSEFDWENVFTILTKKDIVYFTFEDLQEECSVLHIDCEINCEGFEITTIYHPTVVRDESHADEGAPFFDCFNSQILIDLICASEAEWIPQNYTWIWGNRSLEQGEHRNASMVVSPHFEGEFIIRAYQSKNGYGSTTDGGVNFSLYPIGTIEKMNYYSNIKRRLLSELTDAVYSLEDESVDHNLDGFILKTIAICQNYSTEGGLFGTNHNVLQEINKIVHQLREGYELQQ